MQNDDGGEFIILDRWVNLAGIPDFKNPNSTSVMVSVFDVNKQSNYQPPKQKGDPAHKGNDNLDDFPFKNKIPQSEQTSNHSEVSVLELG